VNVRGNDPGPGNIRENDSMKKKTNGNHTDAPADSPIGAAENGTPADRMREGSSGGAETSSETPRLTPSSEAEDRLAALNEKYLRLLAEYDNYRKRTARDLEYVMNSATEKLLSQFLSILDNLDRATEHKNDRTTFEEYVKGIAMIEDQLRQVLSQAGLERMEVIGSRFDPEIHSAVFQQESKDHEPGTIIAEAEKGYTLQGRIIRHPKVVVSR
jgi:molecular chaperone GrpE